MNLKEKFDSMYRITENYVHQKDLTVKIKYDKEYIKQRYDSYGSKVKKLNQLRLDFIDQYIKRSRKTTMLDFGCGNGSFVNLASSSSFAAGYDINAYPLKCKTMTLDEFSVCHFDIITFFDSLEHVSDIESTLEKTSSNYIVISIPECHAINSQDTEIVDYAKFFKWKHRRYGEHLYHFNRVMLDNLFNSYGYTPIVHSNFEDTIRTPENKFESNILSVIYKNKI